MKLKTKIIILSTGFAAALGVVLYPFFADIYSSKTAQSLIDAYESAVSEYDGKELEAAFEAALEYNSVLSTGGPGSLYGDLSAEEVYESLLNINGDGVMGYIVIPSIDVNLPVYHYADDDVLKKGAGHLEGTSLPVGGTSAHCVLSGHRGLPGSKLFTDLDQLETGDIFYLKILGQTLAYEVISTEVVLPEEADSLGISAGEDLCTLVTCTPYGINTHRLLVTAARTEYIEEEETRGGAGFKNFFADYILLYAAACETAVYILLIVILKRKDKKGACRQ